MPVPLRNAQQLSIARQIMRFTGFFICRRHPGRSRQLTGEYFRSENRFPVSRF